MSRYTCAAMQPGSGIGVMAAIVRRLTDICR